MSDYTDDQLLELVRHANPNPVDVDVSPPCESCGGDPGAEDRAERVAEVTAYWRERGMP